jgi:hypothetical protein
MRLPSARDCIDKHANSALRLTTQFLLIDANIDRAERMIRDLLDTNRIRANERLPLHLAECDTWRPSRVKNDDAHSIWLTTIFGQCLRSEPPL